MYIILNSNVYIQSVTLERTSETLRTEISPKPWQIIPLNFKMFSLIISGGFR